MKSFGRYDLLSPLACGGMAELFLARQRGVGRVVVLKRILPHLSEHQQDAFSTALYELCGVRAVANGIVGRDQLVPVQIPRLAMTNEQIDHLLQRVGLGTRVVIR